MRQPLKLRVLTEEEEHVIHTLVRSRTASVRLVERARIVEQARPREWEVQNIERYAQPLVELEDEWEYRRLLEVYQRLDDALVHRLALRGLTSPDKRDSGNGPRMVGGVTRRKREGFFPQRRRLR